MPMGSAQTHKDNSCVFLGLEEDPMKECDALTVSVQDRWVDCEESEQKTWRQQLYQTSRVAEQRHSE
jgi:hypothetical protein